MTDHVLMVGGAEETLPRCSANMLELKIQSAPSDVKKKGQSCTLDPAALPSSKLL